MSALRTGLLLTTLGLLISIASHADPALNAAGEPVDVPEIRSNPTPPTMVSGSPTVILAPSSAVKQGTPLRVVVQATNQAVKVNVGSLSAPLYKAGGNTQETWIGIPVDMAVKPTPVSVVGSDGKPLWQGTISITDGQYRRQNISVSKSNASLKPIPGELEAIQTMKNRKTPTRSWAPPFISPTPDCKSSPFGVKRYHNGVYINDYHKGVDLRSPAGRPIKAINDGTVVIGTQSFRLHGGTVGLDHGWGVSSIYIHMSKVAVKPGDHVTKGQTIGYVGSTGFATGPHLHWGLFANGTPINPDVWIPVRACR